MVVLLDAMMSHRLSPTVSALGACVPEVWKMTLQNGASKPVPVISNRVPC